MTDWTARLAEVNRAGPAKLAVAHLHPGSVSTSFQQSLMNTMNLDQAGPRRMTDSRGRLGLISTQAGAGQLGKARNDAVAKFLAEYPESDLLMFVDSDMGWDPGAVETLAQTLEHHDLDIVGGLCFGQKVTGLGPQSTVDVEWFPTIYRWSEDGGGFDTAHVYPPESLIEVGATGAAFLLLTRRCLETIAEAEGPTWFDTVYVDGRSFGEDMSFCLRAGRHGFGTHVHTGVRVSHKKEVWFGESEYLDRRRPSSAAVSVVIPVKDNLELTRRLISQLNEQGGYTDILLYDNGSTDPKMVEWLAGQDVADVFDASDADGIHVMWNRGIEEAQRRHGSVDVVFLNNDISIGPMFVQRLVAWMRRSRAVAVCGNYDKRRGVGVQPLQGICANRYDGSGGLAGFAFALSAEWLEAWRFDEDFRWWYGDNDLCLSIEATGGWYGMVLDARCEHVGGGSQTATPDGWDDIVTADREAFEAKWPHVTLVAS